MGSGGGFGAVSGLACVSFGIFRGLRFRFGSLWPYSEPQKVGTWV